MTEIRSKNSGITTDVFEVLKWGSKTLDSKRTLSDSSEWKMAFKLLWFFFSILKYNVALQNKQIRTA